MSARSMDGDRLLGRLRALGELGRDDAGRLTRLAGSDNDRLGRDQLVAWLKEAGLEVIVDRIGNIFGLWAPEGAAHEPPVMIGSHIDTVIDAGIYDGCYGVLAGLEVIETLRAAGIQPERPLVGRRLHQRRGRALCARHDGLARVSPAGSMSRRRWRGSMSMALTLGDELARIGYAGSHATGSPAPRGLCRTAHRAGPGAGSRRFCIGAVEALQGISWQKVTLTASPITPARRRCRCDPTPATRRRSASRFFTSCASRSNAATVATVGRLSLEPNAINVIPGARRFHGRSARPRRATLAGARGGLPRLPRDAAGAARRLRFGRAARPFRARALRRPSCRAHRSGGAGARSLRATAWFPALGMMRR